MQIGQPLGDNIDDNQADAPLQIAGTLGSKSAASFATVLVSGTDQLDGRHEVGASGSTVNLDLNVIRKHSGHDEGGYRRRPGFDGNRDTTISTHGFVFG